MLISPYPTKKSLRESIGEALLYSETSIFGPEYQATGENTVTGPRADDCKWWATVTLQDDRIIKVA